MSDFTQKVSDWLQDACYGSKTVTINDSAPNTPPPSSVDTEPSVPDTLDYTDESDNDWEMVPKETQIIPAVNPEFSDALVLCKVPPQEK